MMSSSDARSFFAMRRGYREIYCLIGFTSLRIIEIATARTPLPRGYVLSPEWTTSRLLSFRSFIALRMDGVRRGELVRLISNPRRRPPETIKRSSSLPAWVAQKKHSSGLARSRRISCPMTKPFHEAPTLEILMSREIQERMEDPAVCEVDLGRLDLPLRDILAPGLKLEYNQPGGQDVQIVPHRCIGDP